MWLLAIALPRSSKENVLSITITENVTISREVVLLVTILCLHFIFTRNLDLLLGDSSLITSKLLRWGRYLGDKGRKNYFISGKLSNGQCVVLFLSRSG